MTETLYTRVSRPDFDATNFEGVVIASPDFGDTHGFTELGYDTPDYDRPPIVLELSPGDVRYASESDVQSAAEKAGVKLWLTEEEYLEYWPGAKAGEFQERRFPDENVEPNQLLENPEVRRRLEEAGFNAFRGFIAVSNSQPEVSCFWQPGSFAVSAPLELVVDDPENPYRASLPEAASAPRA